ncbi:MAG: beta strand repeat-containing protein, partial [Gemmatimonadaceae bacterium]
GQSRPLTITVTDANHVIVSDRDVVWTSSNELAATVSPNGIATAHALGSATITATSEGKSGSAQVTVTGAAVGSVTVEPASPSVTVGRTTTLTATVTDANGTVVTDRVVTWSSSNNTVATVSATGIVSAIAAGTAVITATTSDGKSGSASVTVTSLPVGSVAIEPTGATLLPGASTTLTATVRDAAGTVVTDRSVTWTSSNILVASVSTTGVLTAVAPGSATITATAEGKSGTSTVNVTVVPVGSIAIQPTTASLTVGQPKQLTPVVTDANGLVVTDRVVTWTSSSTAVATVSGSGVVTAVAPGTATITATSETKSASATITVTPAPVGTVAVQPVSSALAVGQSTTLAATVTDANGTVLTGRLVTWSSSNPSVATVNATTGVVTGVSVGSATITATSEGKTGTAAVTVTAVPVASVTVNPTTENLFVGQTAVLSATVKDANGAVVAVQPTWTSSNPLVAAVSSTGLLTAVAPGSATITASAGGKSGAASVVVTLVPVVSVAVEPPSASVIAGQTTTLVATVRDANGAVVTDRPVTWTSSNTTVATVSATGVVTAVTPGGATITATSESKSGSATVTVTPVPVSSVTVAPATKSLVVGTTATLTATVKDANGTIVTDRPVTWSSSSPAVAAVSPAGKVTALSVGSATIAATSEGKTGTAAVTVVPVPVASVAVQPATASLHVGQTASLSATVTDANGTVVTDRPVAWTSSNNAVATVSTTGIVTALAPGSATITATAEGKSGSSTVTVTLVPVGSVAVQPPTVSVIVGQTTPLAAVVTDANGVIVTDRAVTWTSSNTSVARVSPNGVVTGVAPGTATVTATSEGKSGSTTVTVTPVPVGSVTVAPTTKTLVAGSKTTLAATVRDANDAIVTDRPVTWTSSNGAVATVSPAGVVTAVAAGTATITATSEGKSGTSTITVTAAPVGSVTVQPASVSLVAGETTTLTATVKDINDMVVTDRTVTWVSNKPSVATVSPNGVVTAVAPGSAFVTASSEGWNGSSAVTVTAGPAASVTVTPSATTVSSRKSVQLTASAVDAKGNPITDRPFTWESSGDQIATVTSAGLVQGEKAGSVTISASMDGKKASAAVTVLP